MGAVLELLRQSPGERRCGKCGHTKPVAEFVKNRGTCKVCRKTYQRGYYEAHRAEFSEQHRAYYSDPVNRARRLATMRAPENQVRMLLNRIRARAASEGLPFDLTAADIFIPTHCPIFGTPLRLPGNGGAGGTAQPDTASLDRIVPELGYVRGNVEVVSLRANRLKNDATAEEHERIAAWMRSRGAR